MHTLYKCTLLFGPMLGLIAKCTPSISYTCIIFEVRHIIKCFHKCIHMTCVTYVNSEMFHKCNLYNIAQYVQYVNMSSKKKVILTDSQKYELCLYANNNKRTRSQYVNWIEQK